MFRALQRGAKAFATRYASVVSSRASPKCLAALSTSAARQAVYTSPLPDIVTPNVSLTDYLFPKFEPFEHKRAIFDVTTNEELTYGELVDRSKRVANALSSQGIGKGDVVGIYSANCAEYYVAVFGISMTGATATLLNPTYSAREVLYQLQDAGATSLIVGTHTLEAFVTCQKEHPEVSAHTKKVYVFGEDTAAAHKYHFESFSSLYTAAPTPPSVSMDPSNDVVILPYSSGTTGLPKGVMLTHSNIVSNVLAMEEMDKGRLSSADKFLGVLPLFHIYGLVINLSGFAVGVELAMMPRFDLELFLRTIETHGTTMCHIVPPIAVALAKHPLVDKFSLKSVRRIMSGAAPLSDETESQLFARLGIKTYQGYGMTELSPVSHYATETYSRQGSVGVLIPNVQARIVDLETRKDVPIDAEGELLIRGPLVMKGYHNRPDATAEAINDDGYLHTGDIARVDRDGFFYVVDRVKELVKYKGFQVPPAELEGLLLSHPKIADVAVVGLPDESCGELPVAFIATPHKDLTEQEVVDFVSESVAPHKRLRGGVRFIDAIPKSASGKILRRVLRDTLKAEIKK